MKVKVRYIARDKDFLSALRSSLGKDPNNTNDSRTKGFYVSNLHDSIVYMHPAEYLLEATQLLDQDIDLIIESRITHMYSRDRHFNTAMNTDDASKMLKPLQLNRDLKAQEGYHRAIWMIINHPEIISIPVELDKGDNKSIKYSQSEINNVINKIKERSGNK